MMSRADVDAMFDQAGLELQERRRVRAALADPRVFAREYFEFECETPEFLQDVYTATAQHPRTLWLGPVGHAKSTLGGLVLPMWRIAGDRNRRLILASKTLPRAQDLSRRLMREVETNDHLRHDFQLEKDPLKWSETQWQVKRTRNLKESTVTATGLLGNIEGVRCDDIFIDDIIDIDSLMSEAERTHAITWVKNVLLARLEPQGTVHAYGSRWHKEDVWAYLEKIPGWNVRVDRAFDHWDGTLLWPERWSWDALRMKQAEMGELAFRARFLNEPVDLGGIRWRFDLHQISLDEIRDKGWKQVRRSQAWDLAISEKVEEDPDYTACITMDKFDNGRIVWLDAWRFRSDFPGQVKAVQSHYAEWSSKTPVDEVPIEDAAYQRALPQQVMKESHVPVVASPARGNKVQRLEWLGTHLEAGRILLLRDMRGKEELVTEIRNFPTGKHDDLLDAGWHGTTRLMEVKPKYGITVRRRRRLRL